MQTWRVFAEPVTYKSHEQMLCTVNVDVMADQAFIVVLITLIANVMMLGN